MLGASIGIAVGADAPPEPAPTASAEAMAPAELDELLAPIALYPDALLAQVLAAAAYPQEVMDGANWLVDNDKLTGQARQEAAKESGFGPPMQALVMFPTVVDMMAQNFDWTTQLGSAFNTDQAAVMASVQRLRAQAESVGNLKSNPQQTIQTQTVDSQQVIVIQPADPKVIYVPTYDPQVVYVKTVPPPAPPGPTSGDVAAAAFFGFFAGVVVGNMFSNNNYYPYPNWGGGGFWYGGRPYTRNVYVYAPRYGHGYRPGYRPGGGYRPPPGYGNSWNRPGYNRGGGYYNRFNGNQNLRPGNRPPALVGNKITNRPGAYKPRNNSGNGNQVTINKNNNVNINRPGAANGQPGRPGGNTGGQLNRPGGNNGQVGRPGGNNGQIGRPGGAATTRPAARPAPAPGFSKPNGSNRGTAFGGAASRPSPKLDHAAAARGRASVGGGGTRPMPRQQSAPKQQRGGKR